MRELTIRNRWRIQRTFYVDKRDERLASAYRFFLIWYGGKYVWNRSGNIF